MVDVSLMAVYMQSSPSASPPQMIPPAHQLGPAVASVFEVPPELPKRPTTYNVDLSENVSVDVVKDGANQIMHRPIGVVLKRFQKSFSLKSLRRIDLSSTLKQLPRSFNTNSAQIEVSFDPKESVLGVYAYERSEAWERNRADALSVRINLSPQGCVMDLGISSGSGSYKGMTRSTFSLLCRDSGFSEAMPALYKVLARQFALEEPSDTLRQRERHAYRDIPLREIIKIIEAGNYQLAVEEIEKLRLSKSQELRRLGLSYFEFLRERNGIDEETLKIQRELSFREDVREDLIFIERMLRNDQHFLSQLFRNLFGRDETKETLAGSQVVVTYFARGCNKQIYTVDWVTPDKSARRFAIASIRDNQMGQGDFNAEEISAAISSWQDISYRKVPTAVKLGASAWHPDWRRRTLEMEGNYQNDVIRVFANDVILIGREFVDDAIPLFSILHDATLPPPEKLKAIEAAATAYWGIWARTLNKDREGYFLSTPRAEDIVIKRDAQGSLYGVVVDMDTLAPGYSMEGAVKAFKQYRYYDDEVLKRAMERALEAAKVSL